MKEWYRFFIDAGANAVVNHHQHLCKEKNREFLTVFGPTGNSYNALVHRKLFPSLLSKGKAAEIYNYLRSEAHRDISQRALTDYFMTCK